jgi:hypothetical protein
MGWPVAEDWPVPEHPDTTDVLLDRLADAFADAGLRRGSRKRGVEFAGVLAEGKIEMAGPPGVVFSAVLFPSPELARSAALTLAAKSRIAIRKDWQAVRDSGPVVYSAECQSGVLDIGAFHELVGVAEAIRLSDDEAPADSRPDEAQSSLSTATELKRLADLHRSGDLNDEEFAAAKARILAKQ